MNGTSGSASSSHPGGDFARLIVSIKFLAKSDSLHMRLDLSKVGTAKLEVVKLIPLPLNLEHLLASQHSSFSAPQTSISFQPLWCPFSTFQGRSGTRYGTCVSYLQPEHLNRSVDVTHFIPAFPAVVPNLGLSSIFWSTIQILSWVNIMVTKGSRPSPSRFPEPAGKYTRRLITFSGPAIPSISHHHTASCKPSI